MKKISDPVSHFWSKVEKLPSGCWEWRGGRSRDGYGSLRINKKNIRAHRFSWEVTRGYIPSGLLVCHSCDNPICVNPAHLWLGTHKQNSDDMMDKGRNGYRPDVFKLTTEQVLEIRRTYKKGTKGFHKKWGVTPATIRDIIHRRSWKHIK